MGDPFCECRRAHFSVLIPGPPGMEFPQGFLSFWMIGQGWVQVLWFSAWGKGVWGLGCRIFA